MIKKEDERELKIIGVQLPKNLRKQLEAEADYMCLSISAMIRLILAKYFRNNTNPEVRDDAKFNDVEGD